MNAPQLVTVSATAEAAPDIEHLYFAADQRDKFEVLRKVVHSAKIAQALVFINKSDDVELTVDKLNYHGLTAAGIHGSFNKEDRKTALEGFRKGRPRAAGCF